MRIFHCDHCDNLVFFENTSCVQCGHVLAFLPDLMEIGSLDRADGDTWRSPHPAAQGQTYRLCGNYAGAQVCNWAVDARQNETLCAACRLTTTIPDLTIDGYQIAWYKLEVAKRRLVYTLLNLHLPITPRSRDPRGLAFEFLADPADGQPVVLTGHTGGVITINLAEADDAERERRRHALGEPYRTLLGHVRHEAGHHYWDRLIDGTDRHDEFRARFGDERDDYQAALQRYYASGAPADWPARFVTAYASAHPWEDWAETWAHYLHITDTLETAAACGVTIRPRRHDEPTLIRVPSTAGTLASTFDQLIASWYPMTYLLNNLNRGLGIGDGYPFVLSPPAVEKLRFVHDTIALVACPLPAAASIAEREAVTPSQSR
jgi:hypothetical protein